MVTIPCSVSISRGQFSLWSAKAAIVSKKRQLIIKILFGIRIILIPCRIGKIIKVFIAWIKDSLSGIPYHPPMVSNFPEVPDSTFVTNYTIHYIAKQKFQKAWSAEPLSVLKAGIGRSRIAKKQKAEPDDNGRQKRRLQ